MSCCDEVPRSVGACVCVYVFVYVPSICIQQRFYCIDLLCNSMVSLSAVNLGCLYRLARGCEVLHCAVSTVCCMAWQNWNTICAYMNFRMRVVSSAFVLCVLPASRQRLFVTTVFCIMMLCCMLYRKPTVLVQVRERTAGVGTTLIEIIISLWCSAVELNVHVIFTF